MGALWGNLHLDALTDDAIDNALMNTCNVGIAENDAMLDISVNNRDAIANAGIGPNIGMFEMSVITNDHGAANFAANYLRTFTNLDTSANVAICIHFTKIA